MATEQKAESTELTNGGDLTGGFVGKVEAKYRDLKEHAETYPYVWASYMVVYGGFGLWFAYRWRKLRRTEDRVRGLQERLRKLAEAEELASRISSTSNRSNVDKPPN